MPEGFAAPPERAAPPAVTAAAAANAAWRAWLPSLPWIVGLLAMLRALASPLALLHDPDTYLHIAAGRWMLARAALPTADPFSFTVAGAHWAPTEWLGELALAAAYATSGWGGVILLTAASFGLAIGLLTRLLLRHLDPLPAIVAALAGAVLVLPHLLARPHVPALPLLVLWCGTLLAARDGNRPPPWPLLAIIALWANLHPSFVFGLTLAAYLAAEAVVAAEPGALRRRALAHWASFVLAALAACLINPNGVAALTQPLRLMAMPALQSGFGEWHAADFADFPAFESWLLGVVALAFLCRARLPWTRLVLLLGIIHMAITHVRHADLLGLIGPLVLAAPLAPALHGLLRPAAQSPLLRGASVLATSNGVRGRITAVALAAAIAVPTLLRPVVRDDDAVTPQSALAAARRMHLTGPVFNSEAFGGYLLFSGVPTFIDGRIEMYGNSFLADYLAAERGDPQTLAALLDRYHIGWTLLQAEAPVAAALDRLPGWHRAYADTRAVIHVRGD
jgi:hypothetical protein